MNQRTHNRRIDPIMELEHDQIENNAAGYSKTEKKSSLREQAEVTMAHPL